MVPTLRRPHNQVIAATGVVFALLPLWWTLGLEQLIWPTAFAALAALTLAKRNFKVSRNSIQRALLSLIFAQVISGLFIVEAYRTITYIRNLSTYFASLCLTTILINEVSNWEEIRFLLRCLVLGMGGASTIGILGILGAFRPSFISPLGRFLPAFIAETTYGSAVANRAIGHMDWFIGLGQYFRLNSTFLFATMYASALAITIPMVLFLLRDSRSLAVKSMLAITATMMTVNLVFTTGRVAILGFLGGMFYYLWHYAPIKQWYRAMAMVTASLALLAMTVGVAFLQTSPAEAVSDAVREVVYARGKGSATARSLVYIETIRGFASRPLFGWGTERDFARSAYPLGSHSYYLGILYKHGIVGFIAFLSIWSSIWFSSKPCRAQGIATHFYRKLNEFGRWAIIAAMINSLTDVLDLDCTTMVILWLVIGLVSASHRLSTVRQHQLATRGSIGAA